MSSFKRLAISVASAIALASPMQASAGAIAGGASEWTQILNNFQLIMVALDSAESAATEASQYLLQMKQYENELRNLAKFSGLPPNLQKAIKAYEDMAAYKARVEKLYGSLSEQKNMFEKRFTESKLRGGNWEDYVRAVRRDASNMNQRAISRLEYEASVLDQVQTDYAAARELEPKIHEAVGAQQSLQVMNTQMNRLLIQNAKLTEVMVASMQDQTTKQHEEASHRDEDAVSRDQLNSQQSAIRARQRAAADAFGSK